MDIRRVLSRNVKELRKEKGLSQEGLAFASNLHPTYISGVERGVRNPTITVLAWIAGALDVNPDLLLRQ